MREWARALMGGRGCQPVRATMAFAVLVVLLVAAPSASAAEPWWHMEVGARPSVLPAAGSGAGELVVSAENVGDARTTSPVKVDVRLPAGLRATGISGAQPARGGSVGQTTPLVCTLEALRCEASGTVAAFDELEVRVEVEALAGASSDEAVAASVTGGDAPAANVSWPLAVGTNEDFGIEGYGLALEGEGGREQTQAGSHPFQATGSIALAQGADSSTLAEAPKAAPAAPAKSLSVQLPAGLVADPGVVPRCLSWQFAANEDGAQQDECPYQSAVGVASVTFDDAAAGGTLTLPVPIFDLEPQGGEPARFGFYVPLEGVPVTLATAVRSGPGEDWGVNLSASDIPEDSGLISARLTFWGVPDSSAHDEARGWACLAEARGRIDPYEGCINVEVKEPDAFVSLPTSCSGSSQSGLVAESWSGAAVETSLPLRELSGCGSLAFAPSVSATPTTTSASSPTGFSFAIDFNTEGLLSGSGVAQSELADTTVSLPEGLTIDPSAGVGLAGCSEAQYAEATLDSPVAAGCPEASKLGTVEIETPLLLTTVYGSLYLAQPYANPFSEEGHPGGSLIALYVVARSRAERGVLIKLAGKVSANPATGQLSVSFENDPQLPFSRFVFHFREGAQAPLISPATCGIYSAQAALTPFSEPAAPFSTGGSFAITTGSGGTACPGSLPSFSPQINVGTVNDAAGVFSPFFVELNRTDAMSEISSYSARLPVGLTADLTGVPFCSEADIQAARQATGVSEETSPSCPQASLIGHTLVGTGVGSVLDYVPGDLYLAGPFNGDPYSVVSVTSAVIGPFDLGTIVIRFGLAINAKTGQVSISPTGSEQIPTIIDGIVTHVRSIKVSIDRTGFTLNPTSCAAHNAESTLSSSLGQSATVSTSFGIDNCKELSFKPTFTARTSGKTSRRRGASLSAKLTTPGKLGRESNIREVKVELPRQLPAQLKTLQQACAAQQFEANPDGCPKASFVGHAKAVTPILPVPLIGPAIFVSHGSAAFPSLVLDLKGYGVTIELVGSTFVSKKGILSATFKTVPDEPVKSFELTLPEGKNPALAANGNLCKLMRVETVEHKVTVEVNGHAKHEIRKVKKRVATALDMPTTFVAQNGAAVHQKTKIAVSGCRKAPAKQKRARRRRKRRHRR